MQALPPQFIFNEVSSGVMQGVKWSLTPPNSVSHALNMVFDEVIGEAVVRKGSTIKGGQLVAEDNTINGLFYFKDDAGADEKLIASVNEVGDTTQSLMYFDGSAWNTGKTGDTAGLKTRFETFLDQVLRLNGTDTPAASTNGTVWGSSAALDTANMPNGKFVRVYKAQMCIAGVASKPDSLYVSSVPNAGGTAISWTDGNREIVFNPSDGGNITGIGEVSNLLIVFKDNGMYRWNNQATDADQLIDIGCSSQESIVNLGGSLLAFFNQKGVWVTSGDQPQLISRRVQKWIDGMSSSFYPNVASYGDGEHLFVSIGDCTVDGISYNNIVLRYSIQTKEWTVYSYPYQFRVFSRFLSGNETQIVGGDSTARVYQIESTSLTDNNTSIGFQIETHDIDFGSRGIVKEISNRIMAYGINPQSAIVQVKVDFDDWITLGTLNKQIEQFLINETLKGHFFRFRIVGTSSTERLRMQGLELPNVVLLDYAE